MSSRLDRLDREISRDKWRLRKIQCKSAKQRRDIHQLAERYGIRHTTLIDYTQFHTRVNVQKGNLDDYVCQDVYDITICAMPYSWVLLNYPFFRKIQIGSSSMLPEPYFGGGFYHREIKRDIKRYKANADDYTNQRELAYREIESKLDCYVVSPVNTPKLNRRIAGVIGNKMLSRVTLADLDIVCYQR